MDNLIKQNVSLKEYTTFKIGGPARYYAEPTDFAQLCEAFEYAASHDMSYCILGAGANTLVPDSGINGLVIRTSSLNHIRTDGDRIIAGCGVTVDEFVDFAAENGLSGAEFAAGLPGSIGGAVYMNARCYGAEFADIVESVRILRPGENVLSEMTHDEIGYAYKHSCFMDTNVFIYDVTFKLHAGNVDNIMTAGEANRSDRRSKGQYDYPSAGCIFKNNYEIGIPAGKLIQDAGLKGTRIGGAQVYDRHANFIVNADNASAADVVELIDKIRQTLSGQGYDLEPEIRILRNGEHG